MGRIDQLIIPRRSQTREIVGPPVALDEDDVVWVDRTDAVGALFVEVPEGGPVGQIPVGLVEQVIAGHPVLVDIDLGQSLPQRGHLVAVLDALPERGLGGVVIRNCCIVALTARRSVQVEDHVHLVLLAPGHHAVGQLESDLQPRVLARHGLLLDGQSKQVVMHRQANGVEAPRLHRIDVGLGAVVLQPGIVEVLCRLLTDELLDDGADLVLGVGKAGRLKHVALLDHPSTEAHAAQQHVLPTLVDNAPAARGQARTIGERRWWWARLTKGGQLQEHVAHPDEAIPIVVRAAHLDQVKGTASIFPPSAGTEIHRFRIRAACTGCLRTQNRGRCGVGQRVVVRRQGISAPSTPGASIEADRAQGHVVIDLDGAKAIVKALAGGTFPSRSERPSRGAIPEIGRGLLDPHRGDFGAPSSIVHGVDLSIDLHHSLHGRVRHVDAEGHKVSLRRNQLAAPDQEEECETENALNRLGHGVQNTHPLPGSVELGPVG